MLIVGEVFLGEQLAALAGAIGVRGEYLDLCVVHKAVDCGRCDDVVGEGLSSTSKREVGGHHDRALLIAGRHRLEERTGRIPPASIPKGSKRRSWWGVSLQELPTGVALTH